MEENDFKIVEISEDSLPGVIDDKFRELTKIKNSVVILEDDSIKAKNDAETIKGKKVGFFSKANVIKDMQTIMLDLSKNQVCSAEVINKMLVYQQKTADTMKYLFNLGVASLANNRMVVKQLKDRLSNAKDSLNSYEKEQILSVIKQLKAQEDILEKQERQSKKINELLEKINKTESENLTIKMVLKKEVKKYKIFLTVSFSILTLIAIASLIVGILALIR